MGNNYEDSKQDTYTGTGISSKSVAELLAYVHYLKDGVWDDGITLSASQFRPVFK